MQADHRRKRIVMAAISVATSVAALAATRRRQRELEEACQKVLDARRAQVPPAQQHKKEEANGQ